MTSHNPKITYGRLISDGLTVSQKVTQRPVAVFFYQSGIASLGFCDLKIGRLKGQGVFIKMQKTHLYKPSPCPFRRPIFGQSHPDRSNSRLIKKTPTLAFPPSLSASHPDAGRLMKKSQES